jgi:hypothetical protein
MVDRLPDDLDDARDATELHRVLVIRHSMAELPPTTAVELFEKHHAEGQSGAVDTALLLGTDWRWRRTSSQVLAGILRSDILDEADKDDLANRLLWPPEIRYGYPAGWLGSTAVEFSLTDRRRPRRVRINPKMRRESPRTIWPPLRQWAATWLLGRRRTQPDDVIELAGSLPARDAAAVITGAVGAADRLPTPQARQVVEVGLGWPHKAPRKAALERLCSWGEGERARDLAAHDPDSSLRRWGVRSRRTPEPSLFD